MLEIILGFQNPGAKKLANSKNSNENRVLIKTESDSSKRVEDYYWKV